MGTAYLLGVPEHGEARLHSAVKKVDDAMCRIRDAGKLKARDRIAVLAALNLAFELADRDASAALRIARNTGAGSSVALSPPAASTLGTPAQSARLFALMQRLDVALGEHEDDAAPSDPVQSPANPATDRTAYND